MTPYVNTDIELDFYDKEGLIAHIKWLYRYCEYLKEELRNAKIRV